VKRPYAFLEREGICPLVVNAQHVKKVPCHKTDVSQFKGRFQDSVTRRGTKRAIIAIAHRVVRTVFVLLARHVPYRDPTGDFEALAVKKRAPRWIRQLKKFGLMPMAA